MIRARFKCDDERPISWPVKHPFWCTGYDSYGSCIVVAYADDEEEITELWPEARDIDSEPVTEYKFTERFPKPDWLTNK
jgi:hypothetical protein